MTEPIPFPTSPYCRVRARVASIWADGPDDGTHPDWRPATGEKVVLTPSIGSQLLTYDVGGVDPIIVTVERVDCVVGEDGFLAKSDGRPVYIAPTDDPLLSATGWTWTANIKGKSVPFAAPSGGVVDLAMFIAAPATDNTQMWIGRIPELVESLRGVESITDEDGDGVATIRFSDGETADLPLPSTRIEGFEDVPGLIDLSDKVEWIKQNGEIRVEGIILNEPGDSYVIPSGWTVSHLRAGRDGAVLEIPYAQYTLGPNEYAGSWVEGLYGTLTLVSGSISQGVAIYEDRLYAPYEHLSDWDPHPEYAMKESLPAIIVGPGRPDMPSTTGGVITGSEPVGAEYRSTDGANVGAWVWMKRPTGWKVTYGSTGNRDLALDPALPKGYNVLHIRRDNDLVTITASIYFTDPVTLGTRLELTPTPEGLTPVRTFAYPVVSDGEGEGLLAKFIATGDTLYWEQIDGVRGTTAITYTSWEPWPTTLPGTPA